MILVVLNKNLKQFWLEKRDKHGLAHLVCSWCLIGTLSKTLKNHSCKCKSDLKELGARSLLQSLVHNIVAEEAMNDFLDEFNEELRAICFFSFS